MKLRIFSMPLVALISGLMLWGGNQMIWGQQPFNQEDADALLQAIHEDDVQAIQQLHARDTNLFNDEYLQGRNAIMPLVQAAEDGHADVVALLLKFGASANDASDTRSTAGAHFSALDHAIQNGNPEVCKLLLAAGADPNYLASIGKTPFSFNYGFGANSTNRVEIAELLLDYGANPFVETGYLKDTPIAQDIASDGGHLVGRMLGQDAQHPLGAKTIFKVHRPRFSHLPPIPTMSGMLASHGTIWLCAAAGQGEPEAVAALLKAGVPANARDQAGATILQIMVQAEMKHAGTPNFDPGPWLKVRDLLVQSGAEYDVFSASGLGDQTRIDALMAADRSLAKARDYDRQTPLHWAAAGNQLAVSKYWVQAGGALAAINVAGETPLHLAAKNNLPEEVKYLLAEHAPLEVRDTNGWTPIDVAEHDQNTELIRLFLSDRSAPTISGRALTTPVHEAAADGNLGALIALTDQTNGLEARNELGLTPLQLAVMNGQLGEAAYLMDHGADINVRDPEGNTLLLKVLQKAFGYSVRDHAATAWVERREKSAGKNAKYLTANPEGSFRNDLVEAASFLIFSGIDVNATNHDGRTAQDLVLDEKTALFDSRPALLKMLVQAGVNLQSTDADGNTPLHLAATSNNYDDLAALVAAGADINARNKKGQTPLHCAAKKIYAWSATEDGANAPFQFLVWSGADVNAQDNDGATPLHVLAATDTSFRAKAVQRLLRAGAKPDLRDKQGRTPLEVFLSGPWPWDESADCISQLLGAGASLSTRDNQGRTPLHYLAALGNKDPLFFIKGIDAIFVNGKVDFNARDNQGETPLLIAAKSQTYDVFEWLVKNGANLDATNNVGDTPRNEIAHCNDRHMQETYRSKKP